VNHVRGVEELCDGGVDILLGFLLSVRLVGELGAVLVIKDSVLATIWTIVIDKAVLAFPVLLCENLCEHIVRQKKDRTIIKNN
jgi:hypothetical protein